jgi:hypothetical protein
MGRVAMERARMQGASRRTVPTVRLWLLLRSTEYIHVLDGQAARRGRPEYIHVLDGQAAQRGRRALSIATRRDRSFLRSQSLVLSHVWSIHLHRRASFCAKNPRSRPIRDYEIGSSNAARRNVETTAYAQPEYSLNKLSIKHQSGADSSFKGSPFCGPGFFVLASSVVRATVV